MNLIEHISTPTRLILGWQHQAGGKIYAVGELINDGMDTAFRYLVDGEDFRAASQLGFSGYPAFPLSRPETQMGVMNVFMRRLPPRSRNDFSQYLEQLRLPAGADLSDFALLGYSGAKLPSDPFSLVWPLDDIQAPAEILLEVAGFRYQGVELSELKIGMSATFTIEPENEHDGKAIRVEVSGKRIGYVKKLQNSAVNSWLDRYSVKAEIERFNGTPERPVIYLFCRMGTR